MYISVKEQQILKTHLKVAKVVDGDGLIVTNLFNKQEEEIRLLGIDAPELRMCGKLDQDERETHIAGQLLMKMGRMAQKFMIEVVPPETNVTIAQEKENLTDAYGRTLAYVYLQDGTFVNADLVRNGYAMVMTVPPNVKFADEFVKLQQEARENNRGLWAPNQGQ